MRRLAPLAAAALLSACATTAPIATQTPHAASDSARSNTGGEVVGATVPPQFQYLYGSGEGVAVALGTMHSLLAYALDKAAHRPADSVVLAAGSGLTGAKFEPCGDKPLAVVFDADETVLWNLGFEARAAGGEPYDQARWERYERSGAGAVVAVPGAVHVFTDLRKAGVTPLVNTNRSATTAAGTVAALKGAGLGDFVAGRDLFLRDGASGKDARRATIAARWCVIAMAGDQLGDFSDRFNTLPPAERRALSIHGSSAGLWGKGWFVLPNPVYGTALKGGVDDIFPADRRWTDPEGND